MKEGEDVPIILGRPLLNTLRTLVDICESKTIRVGHEEITFGVTGANKSSRVSKDELCFMNMVVEEIYEEVEEEIKELEE